MLLDENEFTTNFFLSIELTDSFLGIIMVLVFNKSASL